MQCHTGDKYSGGWWRCCFKEGCPVYTVPSLRWLQGAYVDPPPPVPRKRSALISSMAPASRSLAVVTPCLPPMSAEEAAALEQQRTARSNKLQVARMVASERLVSCDLVALMQPRAAGTAACSRLLKSPQTVVLNVSPPVSSWNVL